MQIFLRTWRTRHSTTLGRCGLVDFWVSGTHMLFYFLFSQARRVTRRTFLRSSQRTKFIITFRRPLPRSVLSGSKLSKRSHGLGSKASVQVLIPSRGKPTCGYKLSPWPVHVCDNSAKKSREWEVFTCVSLAVCHLMSPAALCSSLSDPAGPTRHITKQAFQALGPLVENEGMD